MKKIFLFLVIISTGAFTAMAQNPDAILGIWLNADKDAKIQIYKNGNSYFGKIVWNKTVYEPDGVTVRKDTKNPDPKLRTRNINGLVILTQFKYEDDEWVDGKIYDPKSGKTYSSKMKLDGTKLDIRGYVGVSLFGRTTSWTRSNL
jgi:uncharacterized protein (DUF2147 family)